MARGSRTAARARRLSAVTVVVPGAAPNVERVPAGRRALDRDELRAGRDLARQARREPRRDLVVAASHVVLLVRLAEDAELALAPRSRAGRGGSASSGRTTPRRTRCCRRHPAAGPGASRSRRERLLDPVGDRMLVELVAPLREAVEQRRIAGGRDVLVDRLPDLLEVVGDLGVACTARRRSSQRARCRWPRPAAGCRARGRAPGRGCGSRCGPGRSARRRARRSGRRRTRRGSSSSGRRRGRTPRAPGATYPACLRR